MSSINLNNNPVGAPDVGAPATPPVGTDPQGRSVAVGTPLSGAPSAGSSSLASQQGAQAPRTVKLGKAGPLQAQLKDNREQLAAAAHLRSYRIDAAKCNKAFKSDGTFQGFVNGFVGGLKGADGIGKVNAAYGAYQACGLAAASADEIRKGISDFARNMSDPFANIGHMDNIQSRSQEYFTKALRAYPGLFTGDEQKALQQDIVQRSVDLIKQMDPPVSPQDAANLIKENLDKILYQQFRDQSMITGSDHGIHHIVMGNIHNSLAILDGCGVSPREKLMVLQTMVDHDLGYTTYAAQADFGAAKDHPLASRAYVEGNINSIFTPAEQTFIKDSILSHSYPAGLDQPLDFNANRNQSLRNVVAVVDAMGTTQDTKLPSAFRQKEIQDQLFQVGGEQVKLNSLINEQKELQKLQTEGTISRKQEDRLRKLPQLIEDQKGEVKSVEGPCKQAMLKALDDDKSMPPELKARYRQAITVDFNAFGAGGIVPQFAGSLSEAKAVPQGVGGSGPYKMTIRMEVSLPEKLTHTVASNADIAIKDALVAFNKMASDIAPDQNLGAAIDRELYGDGDVTKAKDTCQVSTSLVDFTFVRSEADTRRLPQLVALHA
ncbi:MAG: hypothetical protein LBB19_02040 [Puniceicoccales bacterium]|jgi:hypothetical protein|nr:hypothetical protein [Puniceicoccales bacterium]